MGGCGLWQLCFGSCKWLLLCEKPRNREQHIQKGTRSHILWPCLSSVGIRLLVTRNTFSRAQVEYERGPDALVYSQPSRQCLVSFPAPGFSGLSFSYGGASLGHTSSNISLQYVLIFPCLLHCPVLFTSHNMHNFRQVILLSCASVS